MGYTYDKTTDPDRAAARWRAQRDLSPSEFAQWEAGVMRSNRGERAPMGPPRPKPSLAGMDEGEDFTKALGRDLGFEKSEYKGAPVYEADGKGSARRLGERGPGIFTPKGGAFSGGDMNTLDVDKVASFDTPQETLRKKYEPMLSKLSADEKEMKYRKARGLDIPEELTARQEERALETQMESAMRKADTVARIAGGRRKQPQLAPPTPPAGDFSGAGKSGNPIIDAAAANFGADDSEMVIGPRKGPLEMAAAGAPAVAFNGRGALSPAAGVEPGTVQIPEDTGDDEATAIRNAFLANVIPGYKPVDRRAQKQAEVNAQREQRKYELQMKILEAEVRDKTATPDERYAAAAKIKALERAEAEKNKTPLQMEQEAAALAEAKAKRGQFEREQRGELSPVQERGLKADAAARATARTTQLMKDEKLPFEKARAQANAEANAFYRKNGGSGMIEDADNLAPRPNERNVLNERLTAQNLNLNQVLDKARGFVKEKQSWPEYLALNNPMTSAAGYLSSGVTGKTPQQMSLERLRDSNADQIKAKLADEYPGLTEEDLKLVWERLQLAGM